MAMDIRNNNDLRVAYHMVYTMADTIAKATGMEKGTVEGMLKTNAAIMDIKRSIRAYQHEQDAKRRETLVKDHGIDGYVIRFEMPDVSDPEAWFDNNERLRMRYSAYDCTGQAFTQWHAFKTLGGRKVCYHSIAFDV